MADYPDLCAMAFLKMDLEMKKNLLLPVILISLGAVLSNVTQASAFSQTGIASYYGPGLHGRKTASGERFNQNAMTAAHRSAPFGSTLKVTNISNGRSVFVRVNDRGPFVRGRVVDVSTIAARQLGMTGRGLAKVRVVKQ
jgi:rare lipoprotein A (peptidoglycan hydrolase)